MSEAFETLFKPKRSSVAGQLAKVECALALVCHLQTLRNQRLRQTNGRNRQALDRLAAGGAGFRCSKRIWGDLGRRWLPPNPTRARILFSICFLHFLQKGGQRVGRVLTGRNHGAHPSSYSDRGGRGEGPV